MLGDPASDAVPEFQPFLLPAIGETLRLLDDPDHRIFQKARDKFCEGVPVGTRKMPRTPALYARKTHWRKLDETEVSWDNDNYQLAAKLGHVLTKQFEEEENLGMMFHLTLAEATAAYPGESLRIASQGAIEKSDSSWRIVHDGTQCPHQP